MLFLTGDTHGDFTRFRTDIFPEQKQMTKEDYVIVLGAFGGVWDGSKEEQYWLDWLEDKPFTTLFVSGNHENYDLLAAYPPFKPGKGDGSRPSGPRCSTCSEGRCLPCWAKPSSPWAALPPTIFPMESWSRMLRISAGGSGSWTPGAPYTESTTALGGRKNCLVKESTATPKTH